MSRIGEIVIKVYSNSWSRGAIIGFVSALMVAIISAFELLSGTILEYFPQLFASLPVWLSMKFPFDGPEFISIAIYFFYWICLGGLAGFLLSRSMFSRLIAVIAFFVILYAHIEANKVIQIEIELAIKAIFSGKG